MITLNSCKTSRRQQAITTPFQLPAQVLDDKFIFKDSVSTSSSISSVLVGADRFDTYLNSLLGKRVGVVVNPTSVIGRRHLVDTLLSCDVPIVKIFTPEHGFRGEADAGELIIDSLDDDTGVPIISLYGVNKKPTPEQLQGLDVIVFDIQDVGVRFYTYISTMHYLMEACAENNLPLIILDRPNPNGDYIDGCILKKGFESFVGLHPIPIVHGLTVGELALMINGEGWLRDSLVCDLKVIPLENYTHNTPYSLPVKPSPNLPNMLAVKLYPSLCLFEGTIISVGRGTPYPFQVMGYPDIAFGKFLFTPVSIPGMSKYPLHEDRVCYGVDLRNKKPVDFTLKFLIDFYEKAPRKEKFFNNFFDKLAGTDTLRKQIQEGWTEKEIKKSWQDELQAYKKLREKYKLYTD